MEFGSSCPLVEIEPALPRAQFPLIGERLRYVGAKYGVYA